MQPLSIIALLCEDIRDEVGGSISIVGALPDNAALTPLSEKADVQPSAQLPRMLGKLSIYIRANFDPEDRIPTIKFRLITPDDKEVDIGEADAEVIVKAQNQAKEKGSPIAGTISRAVLMNFKPSKPGILRVLAVVGDEIRIVGILNFLAVPAPDATTSSTAH